MGGMSAAKVEMIIRNSKPAGGGLFWWPGLEGVCTYDPVRLRARYATSVLPGAPTVEVVASPFRGAYEMAARPDIRGLRELADSQQEDDMARGRHLNKWLREGERTKDVREFEAKYNDPKQVERRRRRQEGYETSAEERVRAYERARHTDSPMYERNDRSVKKDETPNEKYRRIARSRDA